MRLSEHDKDFIKAVAFILSLCVGGVLIGLLVIGGLAAGCTSKAGHNIFIPDGDICAVEGVEECCPDCEVCEVCETCETCEVCPEPETIYLCKTKVCDKTGWWWNHCTYEWRPCND